MNVRTTILLLSLVLLLGSIILLLNRRVESTRTRAERSGHALAFDPDAVKDLRMEAGAVSLECVKGSHGWRMIKPFDARVDEGEINRILATLADLPDLEKISARDMEDRQLKADDYGFAQPRARITLGDTEKKRIFAVGRDAPLGSALYIMEVGQGDMVLTSTNILSVLPSTLADLRDKALFVGRPDQVRKLEIRTPSGFMQLVGGAQGNWTIQQPFTGRADRSTVQNLVMQLMGLRVIDFVAEEAVDLESYGLDDGATMIILGLDEKTGPQVLLIGDPVEKNPGQVFVKLQSEKPIMTVSRDIADRLLLRPDDVRDRRLMPMPPYAIQGIEVKEGPSVIKLTRKADEGWYVVEPRSWKADDRQVSLLLSQMAACRIEEFKDYRSVDEDKESWVSPLMTIRLSSQETDASTPALSWIFAALTNRADLALARVDEEKLFAVVSNRMLKSFSVDPLFYRDREVWNLDTNRVQKVAVVMGGREQAFETTGPEDYKALAPKDARVNAEAAKDLLMVMNRMEALAFVTADPKDLAPYGLEAPRAVITVSWAGKPGTSKVLLLGGDWGHEGVYAMFRGEDVIFVLAPEVRDKLLGNLMASSP
ncbi:MAG: DUF4340 domain-containing protein [Lentisphaerota bacterium]